MACVNLLPTSFDNVDTGVVSNPASSPEASVAELDTAEADEEVPDEEEVSVEHAETMVTVVSKATK